MRLILKLTPYEAVSLVKAFQKMYDNEGVVKLMRDFLRSGALKEEVAELFKPKTKERGEC
jgi:hypothetical protein